jgi:hypothetical protein
MVLDFIDYGKVGLCCAYLKLKTEFMLIAHAGA